MNLRQLEIFYAIIKAGTISGAAKNLHVSQPNVTRVLSHTEQQLGFQLFERVKGKLIPTQEAKEMLPEVEGIYQQLGQFRSLTNKLKKGSLHLRLGAPPILASSLLTPIIAELCEDKNLSIEISTANRNELCDALLRNELDVAVCFGNDAPSAIAQETLLTEHLLVLAPRNAIPLHQNNSISLEELIAHPLPIIGLDQRDPLGTLHQQAIQMLSPDYHHQITVRSSTTAAELVSHNAGIAIVEPWTARQYQSNERIEHIQLSQPIEFHVSILHAEHHPLSVTSHQFIDHLKKSI